MPDFFILIVFLFTADGQFDYFSMPMGTRAECVGTLEHLKDVATLTYPGVDFRGACVPSERIGPSL